MMPALYRASYGYLLRHPWQLVTALAGICIGVAVMVSVDLATESSRRAFLMSMDAVNGEATHQVVAGPSGVDERFYARLRVEEGIRSIAPIVEGFADFGEVTLHLLGVDVFAEGDFRNHTFAVDSAGAIAGSASTRSEEVLRRLVTEPGAVLLSRGTAASLGIGAGDRIDLVVNGRTVDASVASLMDSGNDVSLQNLLVVDIATAQDWLGMHGSLSRIDVRQPRGEGDLLQRINDALPSGAMLLPAAGRTESVMEMSDAFMTNLMAMSLLALLIGIFLIYNSVSFAVVQRRPLIGILRALGLTRSQVFRLILLEALMLGTIGAALGLGLGVWMGDKLLALVSRSINDLYFAVSVTEVSVPMYTMMKGLVAGIGATILAAAVPALEAASYPPRLALTRSVLEQRSGGLSAVLAGAGAVLAVAALLLLWGSGRSLVAGLVAVFMLILAVAICIPLAARLVARHGAPLAEFAGGMSARLAVSGIGASLSRTGVAMVALAVAVSAMVGISIMVDSFRASVGRWIDTSLSSDVYVGVAHGTLAPALVEDVLGLPAVVDHSSRRRVWLESPSGRVRVTAVDMARQGYAGTDLLDTDTQAVWPAFEQEGAVLVSDSYAYRHDTGRGDTIRLPTPQGELAFPVVGTYRSYDAELDAILMSRRTYDTYWDDSAIDSLALYLRDETAAAEVIERIRALSAGRQALAINSNRELRERSMQVFDQTFVITDVLYWLALGVALIGILGAMLALQLERGRELAIFRALGMTRRQLAGMVTVQTGCIGLLSGLASIPLGLVMAWMLIKVINRRAFGWDIDLALSANALVSAVILAIVAAAVAGLYPAWRAAQARPALAMREE